MTRNVTNLIRFFMDELMPPILRDNKYLMYPLFMIWYKGKNVNKLMEFKERFHELSDEEFTHYYEIYDSLPNRETDLAKESVDFIFEELKGLENKSILEVGCGNGYLLKRLHERGFKNLTGADILPEVNHGDIKTVSANIESLPFQDGEYDVVICNHTLEHVINLDAAVNEVKRVAGYKLLVTVPCQRYNRYTFDLHTNFFPQKSYFMQAMKWPGARCEKRGGDWSFSGIKKRTGAGK